jgi:hypothetical protein
MVKEYASLKILIKSFLESFIMGNFKGKVSCISRLVIIMLENLSLIKNKAEELTIGQENNQIFTKENLRLEREMGGVHFGGPMELGMKEISRMVFNVGTELCSDRAGTSSTKVCG